MTDAQLAFYSSWASIISFFISIASLILVGSIKANIVRFRRRQRLQQLIDEINRIPDDAIPLSKASKSKLAALRRNIPAGFFSNFSNRGRMALEIHKHISAEDIAALKEAIHDWSSYSEEI